MIIWSWKFLFLNIFYGIKKYKATLSYNYNPAVVFFAKTGMDNEERLAGTDALMKLSRKELVC